jgi:DNA-binding NarL/FixJ family response regulator
MRTAVGQLLSPSCNVVGSAVDTATLFDAAVQLRPDVVLLDFSLPGELGGFDACRHLLRLTPGIKVIALTATDDADVRRGASEAGCSGFVWKPQAPTELLPTIQAVIEGASRSTEADSA